MFNRVLCSICVLLTLAGFSRAIALDADPLITIDPGKVYMKVNGIALSGRDILDLAVDEVWERDLAEFIQEALCSGELEKRGVVATEAEAAAWLQEHFPLPSPA